MPFSCSNPMHRNHPHPIRCGRPCSRRPFFLTQHIHTHIPEHCQNSRVAAKPAKHAPRIQPTRRTGQTPTQPSDGQNRGAKPARRTTCSNRSPPSCPAHPGMHQNLIHLNKEPPPHTTKQPTGQAIAHRINRPPCIAHAPAHRVTPAREESQTKETAHARHNYARHDDAHHGDPHHGDPHHGDPHHGDGRVRTDDPLLAKQVLSQLSYAPNAPHQCLGQGGFEPPTPRLSSVCSNQLSY